MVEELNIVGLIIFYFDFPLKVVPYLFFLVDYFIRKTENNKNKTFGKYL